MMTRPGLSAAAVGYPGLPPPDGGAAAPPRERWGSGLLKRKERKILKLSRKDNAISTLALLFLLS